MPTVNIYDSDGNEKFDWQKFAPQLRQFIAKQLTCDERALQPNEISIRLIKVNNLGMIGAVEVEILAHAYEERVKNSDLICLQIKGYFQEHLPQNVDVSVWLCLSELGHSWQD